MKRRITTRAVVCAAAMAANAAIMAAEPAFDTLISHRGESVDAPENTLPAYKTAVGRGFGFECDVYLSKDGRVFTFHDKNFKRTTDGANTNACGDVAWDEISRFDVGGWGKWKGSKFAGTRPALLEEVLGLARNGRWLYIDVKSKTADIVPYVKSIFARQNKANPGNTLFLCGSVECGKAFKRLMPEYKVLSCLNCCKGWNEGAPPVPVADIIATTREMGADGVDLRFIADVTTAVYMKAIKDAGFELHVWTVDDLVGAREAFRRGAQTVTTNCAKKLLDEFERERSEAASIGRLAPADAFEPGSVVLFIGDSITHGGRGRDMNHVYGHGYAAEIASRYLGYRADRDLCFLNRGISGDSTPTLLKRWRKDAIEPVASEKGWAEPFPRRTGRLKPDVISLLIGVNDYLSEREDRHTTAEQYAENLESLVSQTSESLPGCTMIVCEPFRLPVDSSPDFVARQKSAREVAERHGLCFVDFQRLFSDVLVRENPNPKYWMWDKCHPTYAAHIRMADWWLQTFTKFRKERSAATGVASEKQK